MASIPDLNFEQTILLLSMLQDGIEYTETERERVSDHVEGDVVEALAVLDAEIKKRKDLLEFISGFPERLETAKQNLLEAMGPGEVLSGQEWMAFVQDVDFPLFLAAVEELIDEGDIEKSGAGYKKPW